MESTATMMTTNSPFAPVSDVERVRLRDLALPRKTTNALLNAGLTTVGDLVGLTAAEVSRIPNLGAKSVIEIERALRPLDIGLAGTTRRPAAAPSRCSHSRFDPELALRQLDVPVAVVRRLESASISCLCLLENLSHSELLRAMDFDTVLTGTLSNEIQRRRAGIRPADFSSSMRSTEAPSGLSGLEAELWSLTSPLVEPRLRHIALEVYGWDGGDRHTLTGIAERHGIDVAAISSLCARVDARWKTESARLPRLEEAIATMIARAPALAIEVESELLAKGLMQRRIAVEGLLTAAAIGGIEAPLTLVGSESRLILPRGRESAFNMVVQIIRKAARNGTALSPEEVTIVARQGGASSIDAEFVSRVRRVMSSLGETTPGVLSHS